jgi:tRNA1Val (adenine37-N6)-methyltransferase
VPDLTRDELKRFGLQMLQPAGGYRFTLDPLLLCDFAAPGDQLQIADLGAGSGVISLVMAKIALKAKLVAFEQDGATAMLAQENARINGLEERIRVLHEDVLHVRRHLPVSSCELVISNPPYRRQGRGKLNPDPGKLAARHETTAGLSDFLSAAKYLVKPSGRICMVYHPSRFAEFMACACAEKLAVLRLRMVHGFVGAEAKVFLVELAKGRGQVETKVLPPLIVRVDDDNYTDELKHILYG